MNNGTMKSVAIGAGIAVLLLVVGGLSFMMARDSGGDSGGQSQAGTQVESSEGSSATDGATGTSAPPASALPIEPTTTTTSLPVRDFAELFEEHRHAVASVNAVTCDTTRQGTAFLVSDSIVYTAASIVVDAAEVAVTIDGNSIESQVIGQDPERNIAVLRLSKPVVDVEPLPFSKQPARVGDEVGAIVRPVGLPLTLTVGRLSSMTTDQPLTILRTDADAEMGSSGGPLIDQRGQVIGIVSLSVNDAGVTAPLLAVSFDDVREQLAGWVTNPAPPPDTFCVGTVDLSEIDAVAGELIAADTDHPQIAALQRTYAVYSQSINSSRAESAFDVLGPAITDTSSASEWAEGQRTSKIWDWRIREVTNVGETLQVRSVFTSTQDGEFGFDGSSTCTRWDITHDLISGTFRGEPYWLINRSKATTGSGPVDCDEWSPEIVRREDLVTENNFTLSRSDRLAGGTVHDWRVGVGTAASDTDAEDGTGEPVPVTLTVRVEATSGFDPMIEIYQSGSLVAENDDFQETSITTSQAKFTVTNYQLLTVRVRDVSNRSGGEYSVIFTTETPG